MHRQQRTQTAQGFGFVNMHCSAASRVSGRKVFSSHWHCSELLFCPANGLCFLRLPQILLPVLFPLFLKPKAKQIDKIPQIFRGEISFSVPWNHVKDVMLFSRARNLWKCFCSLLSLMWRYITARHLWILKSNHSCYFNVVWCVLIMYTCLIQWEQYHV